MPLDALTSRFVDSPALISPDQQRSFEACLTALAQSEDGQKLLSERMDASDDTFWFPPDDWRASYRPYVVKDGILHIPVKGVLLHNFPWAYGNLATGYQYIWKAFERGLADGNVRGIALVEHSPGGEVAGNFDLVDKMFERRGEKPVRAFAHEYAYSAAYSIASVADRIYVSRTGGVGSIGVVTSHVDVSGMMEKMGWKITLISAPEDGHKTDGNPYEALKPEVRKRMQQRIDKLYSLFVGTVARNRGMDEGAVRGTKALTYSADEAVEKGLADEIGTLEDTMAAFVAELSNQEGDEEMGDKTETTFAQADIDAARAAGVEEGKATGLKEGATAERTRINAIIGSDEGKARPKAALSVALKSEMTAEQASAFLADLPEEKGEAKTEEKAEAKTEEKAEDKNKQDFSAAMDKDNPDLGADAKGGDKDQDDAMTKLAADFGLNGFN